MSESQVKPRRAWLAALLSLLVTGLGQLYAGRPVRALTLYFASLALLVGFVMSGALRAFAGLIVFLLACLLFSAWVLWDAVHIARRSGDYSPKRFNRWYVYVAAWLVSGFLIAPRLLALSSVRTFWIPSASMEPTLLVGDHLVADLTHYRSARPSRGDLAILASPENPAIILVERVIGLEGEEIEIRKKSVLIDGRPLRDPWGRHTDTSAYLPPSLMDRRDNFGPLKIPAGMVFVLGDNRDNSYDSRFYGPVPMTSFKGRALYIYWARDKSRIGRSLR